jgi:hypothetical protein
MTHIPGVIYRKQKEVTVAILILAWSITIERKPGFVFVPDLFPRRLSG